MGRWLLGQDTSLIISGVHIFLSNQLLFVCLAAAGNGSRDRDSPEEQSWRGNSEWFLKNCQGIPIKSLDVLGPQLGAVSTDHFAEKPYWPCGTRKEFPVPAEESSSWPFVACQRPLRRMAGDAAVLRLTTYKGVQGYKMLRLVNFWGISANLRLRSLQKSTLSSC